MISRERATEVASYALEHGNSEASRHFGISEESIPRYLRQYRSYEAEADDIIIEGASSQKLKDINNVLRKENREQYRLYNNLETVFTEYNKLFSECPLFEFTPPPAHTPTGEKVGVVQISDTHFNEIIESMEANGNQYDFRIAAKRLHKFISEARIILNAYTCEQVWVFCTGDLINSNRRLSEKLTQATSQVRASLLATYLLQQVLLDLAQDYKVYFAGVVGNESRIGEDPFDTADILASENWDYLIYNQLKMLFEGTEVECIDAINPTQMVVSMDNGFNALLVHGNFLKGAISDKQIAVLLQQYAYRGVPIHGVFIGHIHSASVGDIVSRSSSLCGGNAYSTNDLMFVSRPSQNVYIVNGDKSFHGMKIDLLDTTGYEGYKIIDELERYNVRGSSGNTRITIETLT